MPTRAETHAASLPVFTISREFAAPRDLVFRAFTEEDRLVRWWGPKGFDVVACTVDLRPGGHCRYQLRSPDGQEMWGRLTYRLIVPPERLVFLVSFTDSEGRVICHPWVENWPLVVLSEVVLTERDGRTTVAIRWTPYESTEAENAVFDAGRDSMRQGWTGTLDRLDDFLAGGAAGARP
jgi:uncharacterized protein YndB with AHSA1/START domain